MKKILVYLESKDGALKRASLEAITAAVALGSKLNIPVTGVLVGGNSGIATPAGEYGINEVIVAEGAVFGDYSSTAYAEAVAQTAKAEGADVVILPANAAGLEIGPRIAAKLGAGYIGDCVAFDVDGNDIIATKPVYAGKAQIKTKVTSECKVFSIRPNVFTAVKAGAGQAAAKTFAPAIDAKHTSAVVKSLVKNEGKLDVLEADIVVSGGRGVKAAENYNLIENLADAFGAAVGASRAVVDAGWRPHAEQVGQTGKTVSPTLYVACGISGAIQHLAGMSTSKTIVAINKDKDAPIFKVSDYGIVGDLFDVLPKLTAQIKAVKSA
jgi:electron transfer flavoprotein alpha subunit